MEETISINPLEIEYSLLGKTFDFKRSLILEGIGFVQSIFLLLRAQYSHVWQHVKLSDALSWGPSAI